jgi:hypothetical protein
MKPGVEDPIEDLAAPTEGTFTPMLDVLEQFNRGGPVGFEYSEIHTE